CPRHRASRGRGTVRSRRRVKELRLPRDRLDRRGVSGWAPCRSLLTLPRLSLAGDADVEQRNDVRRISGDGYLVAGEQTALLRFAHHDRERRRDVRARQLAHRQIGGLPLGAVNVIVCVLTSKGCAFQRRLRVLSSWRTRHARVLARRELSRALRRRIALGP